MLISIVRRTVLIAAIGLLFAMPTHPVAAEEFDIVFLTKPSGKYKQPATVALVGCGYSNGLAAGMTGTFYKVPDTGGTGKQAPKAVVVEVQDVTAFASSCLIPGVKLEEITSNSVISFDLLALNAQDYRRMASEALAAGDFERSEVFLEKLVEADSLAPDSSAYQLLDSCRAETKREFNRKLSKKEKKIEKKRASVYHRLGAFFFSQDNYHAARYYLERTIRGDNKREHAKRLLCLLDDEDPCLYTDSENSAPPEIYPVAMYIHIPDYPRIAKQKGITGTVEVEALVDSSGLVAKALVWTSSGSMALDQAAVSAAYHNRFRPAHSDGEPVPVWVVYKVDFVLD